MSFRIGRTDGNKSRLEEKKKEIGTGKGCAWYLFLAESDIRLRLNRRRVTRPPAHHPGASLPLLSHLSTPWANILRRRVECIVTLNLIIHRREHHVGSVLCQLSP